MNTRKILIVSARPQGIASWPAQYETVVAPTDESAIELAQRQDFEAIVLDGTDPEVHGAKLRAILPILQPEAALFEHSGSADTPVQSVVQEHFRRLRNDRIRQYLVLDELDARNWSEPPAFSAN
ncbi:hypothetical protein [Flaviaesturariibacter terrae]